MIKRLNTIFYEKIKNYVIIVLFILTIISYIFWHPFVTVFILTVFLCWLANKVHSIIIIKEIAKNISCEELEKIESELKNPLISDKNLIFTEHYIIRRWSGIFLLKYSEVVQVYNKKNFDSKKFNSFLVIIDKNGKKYSTLLSCSNFPIFDYDKTIEIIIKNRNSNVLIGNTKENKQKLKEMIK